MNIVSETFEKYKSHFSELLTLAIPLIIGNLGQILIGATDVFVAGKYNIKTLAAMSIANSILFSIFIIGIGLMASISIVLSNYRGGKKPTKRFFQSSVNFSLLMALIFCLVALSSIPFIDKIGFEANLVPLIKEYIFICSFSFFGIYLYQGIKEFLQAHEIVNFPNLILVVAVVVHFLLDLAFVFGIGPIPSLGIRGIAIATLLTRTVMGLAMFVYCVKLVQFKNIFNQDYVKHLLKIGSPIGIALLLEFFAFNIITLIVGKTAGVLSATHNIIAVITSTTFMIPLAISNAIAIKVGFYNGAKNFTEIKLYSKVGLFMSSMFMFMCSIILFLFPTECIKIFTNDSQIIKIGVPILFVAAIFQVFDGFQVAASGVLKGLKLTELVTICVLSGYWFLGLPLGYLLATKYDYSLLGFWVGLAVSLCIIGIVLACIIIYKFKKLKIEYNINYDEKICNTSVIDIGSI